MKPCGQSWYETTRNFLILNLQPRSENMECVLNVYQWKGADFEPYQCNEGIWKDGGKSLDKLGTWKSKPFIQRERQSCYQKKCRRPLIRWEPLNTSQTIRKCSMNDDNFNANMKTKVSSDNTSFEQAMGRHSFRVMNENGETLHHKTLHHLPVINLSLVNVSLGHFPIGFTWYEAEN